MNAVERAVPVRGGDLAVTHWPARGAATAAAPVIALHGITSNGRFLAPLARALAASGTPVHAPDLRGRGASRQLPGPYGLSAHVADVLALVDALVDARGPRPILLGHSMGAFVAALAAATHPGRFARLVLVDGGLGFPAPAGHAIDALLEAVIGPAMRRLSLTFPDRASYHAYFREHPALADHFGDDLRHHLDRDLIGEPPTMRSACVLDAVRADGADVLSDPATLAAIHRLRDPATLLLAERGLLNEPRALYDPGRVAAAGLDPATVAVQGVPDTNHDTILLADHAVAAVAAAVTR
ncbi:alpha/beta fold hydrolase [Streptomyces sp. PT12]|uniref:alpha/beta fold hydrolase n=1 Tax=Streptomyces sp. PT12 TaxID=1510197 RepID=UPI000DE46640|nr:alpha/beta fold hydrolase [Streptomyces sp. PT12]RBM14407.1 alpha/beta hydrolase [Streptomyces sp. PT12]